jgi:hypothetical protein
MPPRDAAIREDPSHPEVLGRRQLVHLLSRDRNRLLNSAETACSANAPSLAEQVGYRRMDFRTALTQMRRVEPGQRGPVGSVSSFRSHSSWDTACTRFTSDKKLLDGTNVIGFEKASSWEREVREPGANVVMAISHEILGHQCRVVLSSIAQHRGGSPLVADRAVLGLVITINIIRVHDGMVAVN